MPTAILPYYISATFPRLLLDSSDCYFLVFSVVARNLSMTGSIQIFQKLLFSLKSRLNVHLEVKLPNMTDWLTKDPHQCNPPTLAITTLSHLHPHPSTAPLSQNSREPSTIEPVTTQEPWSNATFAWKYIPTIKKADF